MVKKKENKCPNCFEFLENKNLEICPYCGIEIIIQEGKMFILQNNDVLKTDEFDPMNIWLFTDPVAFANFRYEGKLIKLEQDIRYSVMRDDSWHEDDIEFLKEIKRLLDERIIKKNPNYWFCCPFPPIFKALSDGKIIILGKKYRFKKGEEIVWRCQMGRELRNLDSPVLIGKFTDRKMIMYCKEMENAMKGQKLIMK